MNENQTAANGCAMRRILVAGIGNIFLGDDAFGVETAQELMRHPLPPEVKVADFGIRTYDLAYALMGEYDTTILIDAVSRGEKPGTVFLIRPDAEAGASEAPALPNPHGMDALQVLRVVRSLGGEVKNLYLVGCEPAVLESESGEIGLSAAVSQAVPLAIGMIRSLLCELLSNTETASGKESLCAVQTTQEETPP